MYNRYALYFIMYTDGKKRRVYSTTNIDKEERNYIFHTWKEGNLCQYLKSNLKSYHSVFYRDRST